MNIGVDIDGVLIDDDRFQKDNKAKFLYENHLPAMEFPDAYENKHNFTEEQNLKYRHSYFFHYFKHAKPYAYAKEVLKKLECGGKNKIFIITARFKVAENSPLGKKVRCWTKRWLRKHGFKYEVCFCKVPKVKEITGHKIDLMIDDSPETIPEIAKVTKVFCFDAFYNKKLAGKDITRVYSWFDLLSKFENMFQN